MSNPIKDHNLRAAAMWSGGGRAYDTISRSIAGAIEHAVERLAPVRGERIADIATGTGWASRAVARCGADVLGVDIAEGLLAAAIEIAHEQGLAIDYRLGDAEALPLETAAFDGVISTFGAMFAPDQPRAAAEMARICRPGGRLAIAAWTQDSNAVALRQVLQPFMPAPPVPPPAPPPSPFVWGSEDWLATTFSGSFRLAHEPGVVISRFVSEEAAWLAYVSGFGPVRALALGLDAERYTAMRQAFEAWTAQFRTGLGIAIPFAYLLTIGHRA